MALDEAIRTYVDVKSISTDRASSLDLIVASELHVLESAPLGITLVRVNSGVQSAEVEFKSLIGLLQGPLTNELEGVRARAVGLMAEVLQVAYPPQNEASLDTLVTFFSERLADYP